MAGAIFGDFGVAGTVFDDLKFYLWSISPTMRFRKAAGARNNVVCASLRWVFMRFLSQVAVLFRLLFPELLRRL